MDEVQIKGDNGLGVEKFAKTCADHRKKNEDKFNLALRNATNACTDPLTKYNMLLLEKTIRPNFDELMLLLDSRFQQGKVVKSWGFGWKAIMSVVDNDVRYVEHVPERQLNGEFFGITMSRKTFLAHVEKNVHVQSPYRLAYERAHLFLKCY